MGIFSTFPRRGHRQSSSIGISGGRSVGDLLDISGVVLSGASPIEVLVQWRRDGANIASPEGTELPYEIVASDQGTVIDAVVTVGAEAPVQVLGVSIPAVLLAPVATGFAPIVEEQSAGSVVVDISQGFTGDNLQYVSDGSIGTLAGSILTIGLGELFSGTTEITATNAAGSATVDLSVTIEAAVPPSDVTVTQNGTLVGFEGEGETPPFFLHNPDGDPVEFVRNTNEAPMYFGPYVDTPELRVELMAADDSGGTPTVGDPMGLQYEPYLWVLAGSYTKEWQWVDAADAVVPGATDPSLFVPAAAGGYRLRLRQAGLEILSNEIVVEAASTSSFLSQGLVGGPTPKFSIAASTPVAGIGIGSPDPARTVFVQVGFFKPRLTGVTITPEGGSAIPMELVVEASEPTGNDMHVAIYKALVPDGATADLELLATDLVGGSGGAVAVYAVNNVNSTAVSASVAQLNGDNDSADLSLNVVNPSLVLGGAFCFQGYSHTWSGLNSDGTVSLNSTTSPWDVGSAEITAPQTPRAITSTFGNKFDRAACAVVIS